MCFLSNIFLHQTRSSCSLLQGLCIQYLCGNTLNMLTSSVLYHCIHSHHDQLDNLPDVGRHIFLGLYNCCVLHNLFDLHSRGMLSAVQQHIESAWHESLFESSSVAPPTDDVYSIQRLPHVCVLHIQSQEYLSEIALAARLPSVLPSNNAQCLHGAFPHPAW